MAEAGEGGTTTHDMGEESTEMTASQAEKKKKQDAAEMAASLREEGTKSLAMRMLDPKITLNMSLTCWLTAGSLLAQVADGNTQGIPHDARVPDE